jgi:protocatechuate 3,4-dioxygenase beta subunit
MRRRATSLTFVALVLCVLGVTLIVWRATEEKERAPVRETAVQPPAREEPAPPHMDLEALPRDRPEAPPVPAEPAAERPPPPAAGLVIGTVRLASGELPLGVEVTLRGRRGEPRTLGTVADGVFRFDDVTPGRYILKFEHAGFAPRTIWFKVHETEGAGPFDVLLEAGGAVLVRVIGVARAPLPDQVVRIRADSNVFTTYGPRKPEGPRTDADGRILFEHLAPGSYVITRAVVDRESGMEDSDRSDERSVRVKEGETTEVTFELSCGLTGTVLGPDGQPLVDAIVRLNPILGKGGYGNLQTRTNEEGAYDFRDCAPGEYALSIQVLPPGGYATAIGRLTLRAGTVLDHPVRVPPTSISGRITRADTGAPLGKQQLQITAHPVELDEKGKIKSQGVHGAMTWAAENGRYTFTGLAPGTYRIWIYPWVKGLRSASRILEFSGGSLRDVDFALVTPVEGRLQLRVLGPDGKGARGLTFLIETDENMWTSVRRRNLGNGVYEFALEVGERKLSVHRDGFEPETVEVTIEKGKTAERAIELRESEPEEKQQ